MLALSAPSHPRRSDERVGDAMSGLFDLVSSDDLCAKLDHDYRRVKAHPSDVFAAFDFIVTAWHLVEWPHPGRSATRKDLIEQYPVLALCHHLCVSGKHFAPTDPRHESVQATFRKSAWRREAWDSDAWAQGVWADELVIELSGEAREAFGDRLTMEQFADKVMEFWRGPGGCPPGQHVSGTAM
jgi:hypothetical protein